MAERRAYWHAILATRTAAEIEEALLTLREKDLKVLQYHYFMKHPFKQIAGDMNLSIGMIRTCHNRGIYLLAKFFQETRR